MQHVSLHWDFDHSKERETPINGVSFLPSPPPISGTETWQPIHALAYTT